MWFDSKIHFLFFFTVLGFSIPSLFATPLYVPFHMKAFSKVFLIFLDYFPATSALVTVINRGLLLETLYTHYFLYIVCCLLAVRIFHTQFPNLSPRPSPFSLFSAKYLQSFILCFFNTKITAITLCLWRWHLLNSFQTCRKQLGLEKEGQLRWNITVVPLISL